MKKPCDIALALLEKIHQAGLKAKIFKVAKSGSVYIHFADSRMGKVRVGTHNERERYGYRWQIRLDVVTPFTINDKGHKQFFYSAFDLQPAVDHMIAYKVSILRNTQ